VKPGFLKDAALVPLGVALGLGLFETGLQIAAPIVQRVARSRLPVSWTHGHARVLCIGDSNTYGLYLSRDEAYPQQLEALWKRAVGSPVEVLNLGFPGTNSSRVVRDFPRLLATFEPDLVLLMVGVNDFWTQPFALEAGAASGGAGAFLRRHSLLYRAYRLWRRGRDERKLEIELGGGGQSHELLRSSGLASAAAAAIEGAPQRLRYGDEEFEMGLVRAEAGREGDQDSLERNLRTLVAQARAARTPLYLLSYPASRDDYAIANAAARRVAGSSGSPLIDLAGRFELLCGKRECTELLFEDGHPKALGYRIIAETIAHRLAEEGFWAPRDSPSRAQTGG
jgi:lysophospholipase L1-like esterase